MKRQLSALLAVILLCLLAACGRAKPQPAQTTEPTIEPTTAQITEPWVAPPPMPEGYSFSEYYAKTPTHFFILIQGSTREGAKNYLIRVRLDDFNQQKEILLPDTFKGRELDYSGICGVTPEGVYICCYIPKYGNTLFHLNDVVYRVPLDGGEAELVEESSEGDIISVWYNAASNSLLIYHENEIEALRLDTSKRESVCFVLADNRDISARWYNAEEGVVLFFYPLWTFIDARNRPAKMNYTEVEIAEFEGHRKKPTDEAGPLKQNELMRTFATCGGWFYYVEVDYSGVIGGPVRFYRMKPDGSKKTLLRDMGYDDIDSLEAIGGKLYAMFRYPIENASKDFNDIRLCRLNSKGKIVKTIFEGGDGYISWMHMYRLDDMILLCSDQFHRVAFIALYDPATGKLFTG